MSTSGIKSHDKKEKLVITILSASSQDAKALSETAASNDLGMGK